MAAKNNISPEGNSLGLKTVLLARFSALGDVAMTVPVVYSACRTYPDVHFVFVTRPSMTSIFVDPPENLTLLGVDLKTKYDGVGGIRKLVGELVGEYRPDYFIDLHNVLRTRLMALFLKLCGVPAVHIFKPRAKRRALTRRHNKVMLPLISQRARYREAFFKAGLGISEKFNGLFDGRATAPANRYAAITAPKPEGERWVGIAPFAAHEGKVYPPEQMREVVAMLDEEARKSPIRIFLFGGGEHECRILDSWARDYPSVTSLAGKKFGFAAELALLNHLDVMLSMDSANMHLAAIAMTPTVSIWGATHPYCGFKGWRQTDDDTIQLPVSCRPCSVFGDKPCYRGDKLCLTAIRPQVVFNKIKEHL